MHDEKDVSKLITPKPPFLMVDRIVAVKGDTIHGVKVVSANEPWVNSKCPGEPIMPSSMIIEACAQLAQYLIGTPDSPGDGILYALMQVNNFEFFKPAFPGDSLDIYVTNVDSVLNDDGHIIDSKEICDCVVKVRDAVCAQGTITLTLVDMDDLNVKKREKF